MDISIIIVSFNTRDLLKACLDSLFTTIKGVAFEIIVIDNHSSDGTREMLAQDYLSVRCFFNQENIGFSTANNKGASEARGTYLFFLNSDTVVRENAVNVLLRTIKDKKYAMVGPRLIGRNGKIQYMCARRFPSLSGTLYNMFLLERFFPQSRIFGKNLMGYWDHKICRPVDSLSGAAIIIEKKLFKKIGGFNEEYLFYSEDIDLCYNARKSGGVVFYCADAEIIHYGGESSKTSKKRSKFYEVVLFNSNKLYFKKNTSWRCFLVFNLIAAAASILRLILIVLVGPFYRFRQDSDYGMPSIYKYSQIFLLAIGIKNIKQYELSFKNCGVRYD